MAPVFFITALLAACGGGGGSSDSDPASPEPSNRAPQAILEGPARLIAGTEGTFRLTAEDDDGRIESVTWTVDGALTVVEEQPRRLTVRVPTSAVDGEARVRVRVTDDGGASAEAVSTVTIEAAGGDAPRVDAGRDQRVDEGEALQLNGGATVSPGRSLRRLGWRQTDGPEAVIDGARDQNLLTIVAPQVDADTALTFELEAEDSSGAVGRDTVTVTVVDTFNNPLPTVDAGDDRTVTLCRSKLLRPNL